MPYLLATTRRDRRRTCSVRSRHRGGPLNRCALALVAFPRLHIERLRRGLPFAPHPSHIGFVRVDIDLAVLAARGRGSWQSKKRFEVERRLVSRRG